MILRYLGHAAFELALADGRRIVFDPYEPGSYDGALGYGPIEAVHDVAVVSHDHADHRFAEVADRAGTVVEKAGAVDLGGGLKITSAASFHDESGGAERGPNLVSVVEAEGLRIAHLGDLGHPVTAADMPVLEGVDVMLVPVGGHFTLDAAGARAVVEEFSPRVVVPMHFKTGKCGFPIAPVDEFTLLMKDYEAPGSSELELDADSLPAGRRVIVLDPAL